MKTLALQNGDLVYRNGDLQLVEGVEEITQCIALDFSITQGEWFANENKGLDPNVILEKSTDAQARAEIYRVLAAEERIEAINSVEIESDLDARTRKISFDTTLENGEALQSEVIIDA